MLLYLLVSYSQAYASRLALVIGNDHYQHVTELDTAVADARSMAEALQKANFVVTFKTDADLSNMKQAVRQFKGSLSGGDEAVFYYAGHGVQLGTGNYLLPVDITSENEEQVRDDAIPLQRLLDDLQDQKVKFALAVIDACRDNPFKGDGRSLGGARGLAATNAANGQMIIFSAGTGQRALDKLGNTDNEKNGVFTRVFLEEMQKPGIEVRQVIHNVRSRVATLAQSVKHEQVPALYDQVIGDFYFLLDASINIQAPQKETNVEPPSFELSFWDSIKNSTNPDDFRAYLAKYSKGHFESIAHNRLKQLELSVDYPAKLGFWHDIKDKVTSLKPLTRVKSQEEIEQEVWESVSGSNNIDAIREYLGKYPKSRFADSAVTLISTLKTPVPESPVISTPVVVTTKSKPSVEVCDDCPEMISIPGGSFMMGSSSAEQYGKADEKPRHQLQIKPFALGKYEVTRQQFSTFVDETGYSTGSGCWTLEAGKVKLRNNRNWKNPSYTQSANHPIVCVSFADAEAYAHWLSQKTGKHYRLPTEAEWEYAARAGTQTFYYWGDESGKACNYANVGDQAGAVLLKWDASKVHSCTDGYVYTAPVGSFQSNAFGLYDMLGNVWEWTCSAYTKNGYDGDENSCTNDTKFLRVDRGGSWSDKSDGIRLAFRDRYATTNRVSDLGFRLAQDD